MGIASYGNSQPRQGAVAPADAAPAQGKVVPFVRAATKGRVTGEAKSTTLTANVQTQSHVIPAVGGWNRRIALLVECPSSGNSATVAFQADAPWNIFTTISLKDAAQKQLALFTSGYHLYLANLFGGFGPLFKPDGSTRSYKATTGAGGTGGTITFILWLPQEFGREGIGSYPNMDSSQRLTLDLTINTLANIYSTAPTVAPAVKVTPVVYYYAKPAQVNARGEAQEDTPPGVGSLQFWRTLSVPLDLGTNLRTINLSGRYIRNIIGVFTDGSDVRSDTVRPTTTIRAEFDNGLEYDAPVLEYDNLVYRVFQNDTPTGIFPIFLGDLDPDFVPGNEWLDDLKQTSTSSQLVLKFDTAATGKLYLLINEVEAKGNIFRY